MKPEQRAAIPLAVAALLLLIGLLTSSWFTLSRGDNSASIGLRAMEMCDEGRCISRPYSEVSNGLRGDDRTLAIMWTGRGTLLFGLTALGLAIASAVRIAKRKRGLVALTSTFAGIAFLPAIAFCLAATADFRGSVKPSPGFSLILFFVGLIGVIVTTATGSGAIKRLLASGGGAPHPQLAGGPPPGPQGAPGPHGYGPPQGPQGYPTPPQGQQGYPTPPQGQQGYGPPPQGQLGYGPPPQGQPGYGPPPQGQPGYGPPPGQQGYPPPGQQGFAPPGAPPPAAAPFCPRDGNQARWLGDQQRFFCDRCGEYV